LKKKQNVEETMMQPMRAIGLLLLLLAISALMLADGGECGGKRLLGSKTVEFMTVDHVGTRPGRPPGLGFGLGFEVRTSVGDSALPGSLGEYGWAGNAGTLFWIDPREQLIAIYLVQVNQDVRIMLRNQFRTMVEAAIIN
jgi:CubicO group peptidase (beta-lactamase class C family)